MRVMFIAGNLDLSGGTERVPTLIANHLAALGHEIDMVSTQGGTRPFFPLAEGVRCHSLWEEPGRNALRAPLLIAGIRRLLRRAQPDVVVVVESMLALFVLPAAAGLRSRLICWEHFHFGNDMGRPLRRVARRLAARYFDAVVTLTDRDLKRWMTSLNPKATIRAIRNPAPFPVQVQHRTPATRLVLAVGHLARVKGFDLLLQAWQKVVGQEPEWRLRIVGDGAEKESLHRLCNALGISSSVEFCSATSEIARHYEEAEIYCLSSRAEGFGMVLLEALAFGVPIVSFDCEVGPAEILDGTGAPLVACGDAEALADALVSMIRDPAERERLSAASKERAASFQVRPVIEEWNRLLQAMALQR